MTEFSGYQTEGGKKLKWERKWIDLFNDKFAYSRIPAREYAEIIAFIRQLLEERGESK